MLSRRHAGSQHGQPIRQTNPLSITRLVAIFLRNSPLKDAPSPGQPQLPLQCVLSHPTAPKYETDVVLPCPSTDIANHPVHTLQTCSSPSTPAPQDWTRHQTKTLCLFTHNLHWLFCKAPLGPSCFLYDMPLGADKILLPCRAVKVIAPCISGASGVGTKLPWRGAENSSSKQKLSHNELAIFQYCCPVGQ